MNTAHKISGNQKKSTICVFIFSLFAALFCFPLEVISVSINGFPDSMICDRDIEEAGLRGVPRQVPQTFIPLESRDVSDTIFEIPVTVQENGNANSGKDWQPNAFLLGTAGEDNEDISFSRSDNFQFVCARRGTNQLDVFKTNDGENWNTFTISPAVDVLDNPDMDVSSGGHIFITFEYESEETRYIGYMRNFLPNNISQWNSLQTSTESLDGIEPSIGVSAGNRFIIGFERANRIKYLHTFDYPNTINVADFVFMHDTKHIEVDSCYFSDSISWGYVVMEYYSLEYDHYTGYYNLLMHLNNMLGMLSSGTIRWSTDTDTQNLTLDGSGENFTVVYSYYDTDWNLYMQAYEDTGNTVISVGHVAGTDNDEINPRIFHDPDTDMKYAAYENPSISNKIHISIADGENNWFLSEFAIPDSETVQGGYKQICSGYIPSATGGVFVSWIDTRDSETNIYYNLDPDTPTPTETPIPTDTPTITPTQTKTATSPPATHTMTATYTATSIPATSTPTSTTTPTLIPTQTFTTVPTHTPTPTFTTEPNTPTHTPISTHTPTPTPTFTTEPNTPTHTPTPTYTETPPIATPSEPPSPTDTPVPTETPHECDTLGVTIDMPSHQYQAGDDCSLTVFICNPDSQTYSGVPVFVILDVYGSYFFAPTFGAFDYYVMDIQLGMTEKQVLPIFKWPANVGSAGGLIWYAAMTDQAVTTLFGELDTWEFGWVE